MDRCIIVVPCYNEGVRLDTGAFRRFVAQGHGARFLLVNDGSTDDTATVLEGLQRWNSRRFEVCHLPRNQGKAEAVRQGMLRAFQHSADTVGFWDADLATPLDAIPEFHALLGRNPRLQMVMGARVKLLGRTIERRLLRHYLGRLFATAASVLLNLPVYDTQCGAKLFRATAEIRSLFDRPFCTNWIFDVELLARLIRGCEAGGLAAVQQSIYELPLVQWRDVAGSKVKPLDFFRSFFELARIYWTYLRPGAAGTVVHLPAADEVGPEPAGEASRRDRAA